MTEYLDWLLTPQRVAIHRPSATAVVADLHLGYQEARRQSGDAIPLLDLDAVLAPLLMVLQQGPAKNLVIAGDLFERAFDLTLWHAVQSRLEKAGVLLLGLIPGNHDRGLDNAPPDLPLLRRGHRLGVWHVLHGDGVLPKTPVVLGHFHPSLPFRGQKIPCYLAAPDRLLLPAYSQEAAGGNVLPIKRRQDYRCFAIVSGEVIDVRTKQDKPRVEVLRKSCQER